MTGRRGCAAVLAVATLVAGCGYRLAGTGTNVPSTARTISIEAFKNASREKGLEIELQRAIEQEFRRRGDLEVVDPGEGDLVLTGSIRRFWSNPVAFSATLEAVQFQSNLLVSLKLSERASKKVLYQNAGLTETTDFGALTGTVVAASPRFQEDTINARDLVNFTNVQIGESRRRAALSLLIEQTARDIYVYTVEAF
jgi:Lipopolysaccharide-assembly